MEGGLKEHEWTKLLDSVYESGVEGTDWSATALRIEQAYGLRFTGLVLSIEDGWRSIDDIYTGDLDCGMPLDMDNPTSQLLWTSPRGRALAYANVQKLFCKPSHQHFLDYLRRSNIGHIAHVLTSPRAGRSAGLFLFRTPEVGPFSNREVNQLSSLSKHIDRSIRLSSRLNKVVTRGAFEALNLMRYAVFGLDDAGRPMLINDLAQELLSSGDGLRLIHGRLQIDLPEGETDLADLQTALRPPVPVSFSVHRAHGDGAIELTIIAAPRVWADLFPGVTTLLVAKDPEWQAESILARMQRDFDLTETEARVAQTFVAERGLPTTARRLGMAAETARRHIKNIFSKTNTHSQAELLYLLTAHPASIFSDD